ncbi:hypothetical protein JR316_0001318 [Psilocybe cubensis]|uniref:Uncharacterized protein n=2 Tax=Psilocybe cubensis TaxID=181762 RepID=A0ACB8HGU3_PSICU|nr:hypothetical protein JR316_0001318 [Psilocybe cubensis]KAH9487248.1 hypothetical protein JR316_0001318 [Psilocybe cubensis]
MSYLVQIFVLLLSVSSALSTTIPGVVGPDVSLAKDSEQYKACKAADPNSVAFVTAMGHLKWYNITNVFRGAKTGKSSATPYIVDLHRAMDEECTQGPTTPGPVDVPVSLDFLNAADFVELMGQSAYCSPNSLPRVDFENVSPGLVSFVTNL